MNAHNLNKAFAAIGARVRVSKRSRMFNSALLRVDKDKTGEYVSIIVDKERPHLPFNIHIADINKTLKQLTLSLTYVRYQGRYVYYDFKISNFARTVEHFLIGKDECHLFIASVKSNISVKHAFAELRPLDAHTALTANGVKDKSWCKRKTKAYIRQGEWFFIPATPPSESIPVIHKKEPIGNVRSPHIVDELMRFGGQKVYVNGTEVLTLSEFKALAYEEQKNYSERVRDAQVFARGYVRHADHKTIYLEGWHEVHMNREVTAGVNGFID